MGVDDLAHLDSDEAAEAGASVGACGSHTYWCGEGRGAHVMTPGSSGLLGWVFCDEAFWPGVVSSKKRRSSPTSSAGASRRSTPPASIATRATPSGSAATT